VQRAHVQGALKNGIGSVETDHVLAHAMTLAFADRATLFGDPDFVNVPVEKILQADYLDKQWSSFRAAQATDAPGSENRHAMAIEPNHTTHFVVMDRQGNTVSVTFSVNDLFGSGFVPSGTGVVMNNHMDDFSAQPGAPNLFGLIGSEANAIAAHKRPLSSMTPTIVRDLKGHVRLAIGGEGGPRILTAVFQSLVNRIYYEEPLSDAIAAPRIHHQWRPNQLVVESRGIPFEIFQGLKEKGYLLDRTPRFIGKINTLERMPEGWVVGMSDVRGEGAAVPE
jgi:gamma-glutamyltranspeptidase/glutathione hydrolase